jgi:hypothetical protein
LAQLVRSTTDAISIPSIPRSGTPRGSFVLISAGRDGILLFRRRWPGVRLALHRRFQLRQLPDLPLRGVFAHGPKVFEQFDDIVVFGGNPLGP